LVFAYARVLAEQGRAGASIAAIASEAGVVPGLVHHYFADRQELELALVETLLAGFRRRMAGITASDDPLAAYLDAALALDGEPDRVAARAWVGVFAEAIADPVLFQRVRRLLDAEVGLIERLANHRLDTADASAVLAFMVGALVFGAFAPRKAAGFAAPTAKTLARALAR
jgi:TetR/AcrR family transcriptional repressor of bet genes